MFNPQHWLRALSDLGGGYALTADRRLILLVDRCSSGDLAPIMAQIIGQPARQEALKRSIEQLQLPGGVPLPLADASITQGISHDTGAR